jgi:ligand-binding sensor domain-containing protein
VQQHLSLTYYNNMVLALGSDKVIYQSADQGITWKESSTYALPSGLQGTVMSLAADSQNRLWLVTDAGEVWLGKK